MAGMLSSTLCDVEGAILQKAKSAGQHFDLQNIIKSVARLRFSSSMPPAGADAAVVIGPRPRPALTKARTQAKRCVSPITETAADAGAREGNYDVSASFERNFTGFGPIG
jgi:hypothetical protein